MDVADESTELPSFVFPQTWAGFPLPPIQLEKWCPSDVQKFILKYFGSLFLLRSHIQTFNIKDGIHPTGGQGTTKSYCPLLSLLPNPYLFVASFTENDMSDDFELAFVIL